MTVFILVSAIMILVALALFVPALRGPGATETERTQASDNLEMARQRLAELEAELASGEIDQARFDEAREELTLILANELGDGERAVAGTGASAKPFLIGLVLLLPVLTAALYLHLGMPAGLSVVGPGEPRAAMEQPAGKPPSFEELLERLVKRLEQDPDNAEGWVMLGRGYKATGRFADAVKALEKAQALVGDSATVMVELADAIAMSNEGRVSGRPQALLERALEMEPGLPTAQWLLGVAAMEQERPADALRYWRKAAMGLRENPDQYREITSMIQQAEAGLDPALVAEIAAELPLEAPPPAPTVTVNLSMSPEMQAEAKPDEPIFLFARAPDGPPLPVAAGRLTVGDLPATLTLDDSMAMVAERSISKFAKVVVGARVSRSGQPMGAPGDLESALIEAEVGGGSAVDLVIDQVRN